MKYLLSLVLFLVGCNHGGTPIDAFDYPNPPPPPNILPWNAPPSFEPSLSELAEIQINPLPHPFNVNGNMPYAVWFNGEKLNLNAHEIRVLAKSLNLRFKQPANTAQIHNGEGWLYPLDLNKEYKKPKNPFVNSEVR